MTEQIVETKKCMNCGVGFSITDMDMEFYRKISPVFDGKRYLTPAPTYCPTCRQQRRLAWQNMSKLYRRKCSATGKMIISNFSEEKPYKIFDQKFWWSDQWNFEDYGRSFDFNKSFFEQFNELLLKAPLPSLFTEHRSDVNSDFTNFAGYNKNCYLVFHADMNEDCLYATGLKNSKKCVDALNVFDCEFTYECIDCKNCYNLKFSQDCEDCADSLFLRNCVNSKNCFGSVNLNNAEYMIFNKKVSKEEYDEFMGKFNSSDRGEININLEKVKDLVKILPRKALIGHQNENCEGDHIFECKNVKECYDVKESRDMKFCERIYNGPNRDCYDVDQFGMHIERIYESSVIGQESQNVMMAVTSYNLSNVLYSVCSFHSQNCFGCVGIDRAKYCILNKQYTKEEYEKLVPEIIKKMALDEEWGEFFPISMSPFAYNETVAQEYFPLTKDEISEKGFQWKLEDDKDFQGTDYFPLSIEIYEDEKNKKELLNGILKCEITGRPFRIVKQELEFYLKHKLPIPTKHPDQRHKERMALRNPRKLRKRSCNKCKKEIQTTYSSERPEIVYCEECYNKEVY